MDSNNTSRRIRESAPFRKSASLTKEDINIELELEKLFTLKYPDEAPFTFSKTISKALGVAYEAIKNKNEQEHKKPEMERSVPSGLVQDRRTSSKHGKVFGKRL